MTWKNFQPVKAGKEIAILLGSLFVATWPNIITNLLSDLIARGLKIETPAGVWSVIAAAVGSVIMYGIGKTLTRPGPPFNAPNQSESNARYFAMQGGMLTLGITLSQACQGMFSGPLSEIKIMNAVISLIPALEGALGAQFIHLRNNQPLYYLDTAIKELVMRNPHVNERMILEHAKGLARRDDVSPFDALSQKETGELVRASMVHLTTHGDLDRYFGKDQRLSIVSLHGPNQWRIEKKDLTPVKPVDAASTSQSPAKPEQQVETEKIDRLQREAWKKWQSNYADRESLRVLLEEEYHTKHGLSAVIKLEIANMINHILSSVIHEDRDMTQHEREKLMILNKLLGEENL